MVVAPVAVGTLWRLLYNDTAGPINNHFLKLFNIEGPLWLGDIFWAKIAVLIVEVWQWTPFVFIVITAALTLISQEMLKKGYLASSICYTSIEHTDSIVDKYLSNLN